MTITDAWTQYLAQHGPGPSYDANEYDELRYAAYSVLFGTATWVHQEPLPTPPFIVQALVHDAPETALVIDSRSLRETAAQKRRRIRPWSTLVTIGMSNERMPHSELSPDEPSRVELAFQVGHRALLANPDLSHFCCDVLLHYAKACFLDARFIRHGDVVPVAARMHGQVRFYGDDTITALAFVRPPAKSIESALPKYLTLDGDPVGLLFVVPLTAPEAEVARRGALDSLLERGVPLVYDGPRPSVIKDGLHASFIG